jgi:undecaprenyl-diphosphatase
MVAAVQTPQAPIGRTLVLGPPPLEEGQHFTIDPVTDGVLIGGSGGVDILLSLILSTGEIQPAAPTPNAASNLLAIDRLAVTQHVDPNAGTYSTVGLGAAISFAVIDPLLSAWRDGWDAGLVDAVMYGETISLTEALTDITKIAVRRPRPIDYYDCSAVVAAKNPSSCSNDTDLSLSFFSGHASTVGAIGATATYLAFQRSGIKHWRGWVTLATSLGLTSFVSIERVRSGEHFPTDVIAGSLAGAMIGTLVPHLHKHLQEAPPVWIGFAPSPGGGSMTVGAIF